METSSGKNNERPSAFLKMIHKNILSINRNGSLIILPCWCKRTCCICRFIVVMWSMKSCLSCVPMQTHFSLSGDSFRRYPSTLEHTNQGNIILLLLTFRHHMHLHQSQTIQRRGKLLPLILHTSLCFCRFN